MKIVKTDSSTLVLEFFCQSKKIQNSTPPTVYKPCNPNPQSFTTITKLTYLIPTSSTQLYGGRGALYA
jgi:hypothetical protein